MIQVFDNVLDFNSFEHAQVAVMEQTPFKFGWRDRRTTDEVYLHSRLDLEALNELKILQHLTHDRYKKFIKPTLFDFAIVNCDNIGSVHYSHTHKDTNVFLLYLNETWNQEWGGETLFFDKENGKEIEFACTPKPNRAIWFDGEIPHSIRAPIVNKWRFSISLFFRKEQ